MMFRSNKLRDSARDQACTFQIPGICNYDLKTVVLCHLPDDSGTGKMAGKSEDICAAFGCSACHDLIDRRVIIPAFLQRQFDEDREFYMRRAMLRTWRKWLEMEVLKVA